jgi:hypothetical protein
VTEQRPKRIQLRRTKGWRKPDGAVVVSRPGPFGNPYSGPGAVDAFRALLTAAALDDGSPIPCGGADPYFYCNVSTYGAMLAADVILERLAELRGKDLCCWCPLDKPCHADVLLEIANQTQPVGAEIPSTGTGG